MTYGPNFVRVVSDGQGGYRIMPISGLDRPAAGIQVSTVVPGPREPLLRWRPPVLVNPTIVNVPQGFYSGSFGPNEDVLFRWPASVRFSEFISTGGRNLVTIGGASTKGPGGSVVQMTGVTGTSYFEGMAFDLASANVDALNICGSTSAPYNLRPNVIIQNSRIVNVNGTDATNHADVFQAQGSISNLFIDRLTFSSNYQGLFISQDQVPVASAFISRTNMRYTAGGMPVTYLLWDADNHAAQPLSPIYLDQVYAEPRAGQNLSQVCMPTVGYVDAAGQPIGILTDDSWASAYWPNDANIWGRVIAGPPPGGDFCPSGVPGIAYTSPGYV